MSSKQLSYEELLAVCDDLRKTAARAISIKQELIETQHALDRELDRYRQIQRYVERALPLDTLEGLAILTAEMLVESYEVEAALFLLFERPEGLEGSEGSDGAERARVLGSCGLSGCPQTLPLRTEWLAKRAPEVFAHGSQLIEAWSPIAARDALLFPLQDYRGQTQGALAALRTTAGADFYPDLQADAKSSLGVLGHQAAALLCNLQATQVIRRQVADLRDALAVRRQEEERRAAEERRAHIQEEIIAAQRQTLRALGTPVIPIRQGVLAVPLIGAVDRERAQLLIEAVVRGVAERRATTLILDVTGVPAIDVEVGSLLLQMARSVRLLGAEVLLSGIRPEVARLIVGLDVDFAGITTTASLQSAIDSTFKTAPRRSRPA